MLKKAMAGASLLALAACGGGGSEEQGNGTAARPGGDAGGAELAATLQPGEYEVTTQFVGMEGPNVPPQMSAALKGKIETDRNCLTEKELKESQGSMFSDDEKQCSENTINLAGGKMSGTLKCGTGTATTILTIDGRYSAQSYEADMSMQAAGATTRVKMSGRRVGECKAGEGEGAAG